VLAGGLLGIGYGGNRLRSLDWLGSRPAKGGFRYGAADFLAH
jgi:hypothetical protein